jgi:hypothetical protein
MSPLDQSDHFWVKFWQFNFDNVQAVWLRLGLA